MSKRVLTILAVSAILLGVGNSLVWVWQSARAGPLTAPDVPPLIGYQGRLTDAAGDPLTGDYDVRFCLYAVPTGGSALWCETHAAVNDTAIPVSEGVFGAMLGSITPIPEPLFDEPALYLGMKVEGDTEMAPRRRIVSVGYAYRAEAASTAGYASSAGDADTVDGEHAGSFANASHAHDASHITSGTMPPERISGTAWTSANDGSGSGLDADAVDGIHASSAPQANRLLPLGSDARFPPSVIPFDVYDSGWFAVEQSSSYVKTHNLGTTKVAYWLFFSTSSDGSNPMTNNTTSHYDTLKEAGLQLTSVTPTVCTLVTGSYASMIEFTPSGRLYHTSGYARILMMALE